VGPTRCRVTPALTNQPTRPAQEEEEEEFITSGNWRGKHNSLSRGAGADQEEEEEFITISNWRGKHNSLSRGAGADQP
jgi:hypothetical protein